MIRVAVVGYGYWGPNLVRNFSEIPGAELAACCDARKDRLQAFRQRHPEVRATAEYRDILSDGSIDAVVLATQVVTHYKLAREALKAGKHVMVEKPLCHRSTDGEKLLKLARARRRVLMAGHTFVYNVAVEKLRQLVQGGTLGKIYYVHSTRVNLGLFQEALNVTWDLAAHDISILNYVFGSRPGRVQAVGKSYIRRGIEDIVYVTLHYPGGVMAHLHVSWLDPCKIRRMTLVGERKMVVYDDIEPLEKIKIFDKGVELPSPHDSYGEFQLSYRYGSVVSPRLSQVEPLKAECRHFLDCIRRGKAPRSGPREGLEVVRVLEACERSLRSSGRLVKV